MKLQPLSLKKTGLTFLFFASSLLVMRCSSDDNNTNDPSPEELTPSVIAELYRDNCGGCHGQNLATFVERDWVYGNSSEDLFTSIHDGYAENGMPSYGSALSDEEISAIADYILSETEGVTQEMLLEDNPDLSGIIESEDMNFRLEVLTDEINGVPWGLTQLPNQDLLVTERTGSLYRITTDKSLETISGLPSMYTEGQGGLLDIEIHPNFAENNTLYFSYSKIDPNNQYMLTTAVARAQLQDNALTEVEDIFIALPYHGTGHHFGSRLQFDENGYLYVTVGDRGNRDVFPQDLDAMAGKVHRIHDDGSIPADNPFVNGDNPNGSIYSYGIRNPQGLTRHPVTGDIWEGEHGPRGGDEINIIASGNNYGWPVITYGINYDGSPITDLTEMEGMEQPIHYWVPSIAPAGMDFVSGDLYYGWTNDLFVGALSATYLHRLIMNGDEVIGHEELLNDIGRVRDVQMGLDGYLYLTVESPGRVIRIVPEN
ncbi:PQQ-dependent sugar dehydrogenase [Reichenbachiella ulvae]|uniref:PQQ-dependent sugar dehydrogenase n=1 Tax=Reichenbachiella ulvae TaxID=2980104 RepID=A0ABT3CQG7_9BACT|nr:PQQ-dependent sugar dehydrogenase [Reichenbachiella ulvae]MCV9385953.1 PQQ-dependent sugar dehydrogenase [Reichenbachiella ulvae]